jgi:hypothetical protein
MQFDEIADTVGKRHQGIFAVGVRGSQSLSGKVQH